MKGLETGLSASQLCVLISDNLALLPQKEKEAFRGSYGKVLNVVDLRMLGYVTPKPVLKGRLFHLHVAILDALAEVEEKARRV